MNIAIERGVVESRSSGLASIFSQNLDWFEGKKINFIVNTPPEAVEKAKIASGATEAAR